MTGKSHWLLLMIFLKYVGERCERCNFGYYNLSSTNPLGCQLCQCNLAGSTSPFCDPSNGQCQCKTSTQGLFCDECLDGFYGLDAQGCQSCDCDAAGTVPGTSCNKQTGQCVCKANTMVINVLYSNRYIIHNGTKYTIVINILYSYKYIIHNGNKYTIVINIQYKWC